MEQTDGERPPIPVRGNRKGGAARRGRSESGARLPGACPSGELPDAPRACGTPRRPTGASLAGLQARVAVRALVGVPTATVRPLWSTWAAAAEIPSEGFGRGPWHLCLPSLWNNATHRFSTTPHVSLVQRRPPASHWNNCRHQFGTTRPCTSVLEWTIRVRLHYCQHIHYHETAGWDNLQLGVGLMCSLTLEFST